MLANPPISDAAIRQRSELVAALGTYLATLAAVADRSGTDVVSASLANLSTHTLALQKAASEHDTGDLFIDEAATALAKSVDRMRAEEPGSELTQQLEEADPIVRRLIAILASDAARQRAETADATRLAFDAWLANRNGSVARVMRSELPSCSEPAIFERAHDRSFAAGAVVSDAHGIVLRERAKAASLVDPAPVLQAIATLDNAEMSLLRKPGDPAAAKEAAAGRELLAHVADAFDRTAPQQ